MSCRRSRGPEAGASGGVVRERGRVSPGAQLALHALPRAEDEPNTASRARPAGKARRPAHRSPPIAVSRVVCAIEPLHRARLGEPEQDGGGLLQFPGRCGRSRYGARRDRPGIHERVPHGPSLLASPHRRSDRRVRVIVERPGERTMPDGLPAPPVAPRLRRPARLTKSRCMEPSRGPAREWGGRPTSLPTRILMVLTTARGQFAAGGRPPRRGRACAPPRAWRGPARAPSVELGAQRRPSLPATLVREHRGARSRRTRATRAVPSAPPDIRPTNRPRVGSARGRPAPA